MVPSSMLSLVDRMRRLPRPARQELYRKIRQLGAGALATRRYDWATFWARPDQLVTEDDRRAKLLVFTGERGEGKTRAAVEFFIGEILAGRAKRPRIIASKASDVWGVVIHGESGLAACLPPWVQIEFVPTSDEAPAGIVRLNGVKIACFGAHDEEATTAYAGDLDLYDDTAKWKGEAGKRAFRTARVSCRSGRGIGVMATTRKGMHMLRRAMETNPEIRDEIIAIKQAPRGANAGNLTAGYHQRVAAELGEEALDDEGEMRSPFAGLEFDAEPIRALLVGALDEIAIGVDPAEGKGRGHDDWGIVASGSRLTGHLVALEDGSGDFDDTEAGLAVLELADRWQGRARRVVIVVESNRGPRAATAIRNAYLARELARVERGLARRPMPEILTVKRDKNKRVTFGEVTPLYRSGLLHHAPGLGALEAQMRTCDPDDRRPKANDRIDGLVTGVFYLARLGGGAKAAAEEEQAIAEAAAACAMAARMNAAMAGGARGAMASSGDYVEPAKVEGAPVGDARHAAPARPGRAVSWRSRAAF